MTLRGPYLRDAHPLMPDECKDRIQSTFGKEIDLPSIESLEISDDYAFMDA